MIYLYYLIIILWSVRILTNILSYIHLWWVKEYRWDRMIIHLHTDQGKQIFFPPFRRPPISPKSLALLVTIVMTNIVLLWILPGFIFIKILALDLLSFPLTWIWVSFLSMPTFIYHRYLIQRALKKFRNHQTIKTIGITGSFGKTSVKEYLATILSVKYQTLKTEGSKNSPIGIAEVVLSQLGREHEVFVVEMGAYKLGEIAQMSDMVTPQVGIITAINPQHQDLFGSLENTMRAKYELIESLPKNGIAIFNADDARTLEMANWAKKSGRIVYLYSKTDQKLPVWADKLIFAKNIKVGKEEIAFSVHIDKETCDIVVKLLGIHQVSNILAAISGAYALGMSLKSAAQAAGKIIPFTKTMEPVSGINGALFINDTFNNNPDAAKAAIDYLRLTKGKKLLVFQPMVELGKYAVSAHCEVGMLAAKVCDWIILTNSNFIDCFREGVSHVDSKINVAVMTANETAVFIKKNIKKGDTVLFKGKEAENALKFINK